MTGHGATCCFNLTRSQAAARYRLQSKLAETYLIAARGNTGISAFLFLTEFSSSWL
jgi:hypothetical protein